MGKKMKVTAAATFEVETVVVLKPHAPIPEVWLDARLLNMGNATAYDVQVAYKKRKLVGISVSITGCGQKNRPHLRSDLNPHYNRSIKAIIYIFSRGFWGSFNQMLNRPCI